MWAGILLDKVLQIRCFILDYSGSVFLNYTLILSFNGCDLTTLFLPIVAKLCSRTLCTVYHRRMIPLIAQPKPRQDRHFLGFPLQQVAFWSHLHPQLLTCSPSALGDHCGEEPVLPVSHWAGTYESAGLFGCPSGKTVFRLFFLKNKWFDATALQAPGKWSDTHEHTVRLFASKGRLIFCHEESVHALG